MKKRRRRPPRHELSARSFPAAMPDRAARPDLRLFVLCTPTTVTSSSTPLPRPLSSLSEDRQQQPRRRNRRRPYQDNRRPPHFSQRGHAKRRRMARCLQASRRIHQGGALCSVLMNRRPLTNYSVTTRSTWGPPAHPIPHGNPLSVRRAVVGQRVDGDRRRDPARSGDGRRRGTRLGAVALHAELGDMLEAASDVADDGDNRDPR
jgi:hypothetical protein